VTEENERKEYDDGSQPGWRVIMAEIKSMMRNMVPPSPVTFVIPRRELETHLKDRAMHYRNEAEMMLTGTVPVPFVMTPPHAPKTIADPSPMAVAFEPDPPPTMIDMQEIRKTIAEGYRARARRFEFMAAHLANVESFTLGIFDFEQYELAPDPYANIGHFAARR
jgi:hypothetical protein